MKYISGIDGLRAIAVMSVVLFHAGFQTFSGGFIGVDVFFVISGYLITKIIYEESKLGHFSYVNFYIRRIKRILPAFYGMLIFTLILGYFVFLPEIYSDFAQSGTYSNFFSANIFFWQQTDYFAPESHNQPLLHTWSLGIEEQFYIFLPPLVAWLVARKLPIKFVLLGIAVVSFIVCVFATYKTPVAAFYLLPTRAWELLLGSLLAVGLIPRRWSFPSWMVLLGFVMLIAPIFLYDENTIFPGWAAFFPVTGTFILIYALESNGKNLTILSNKVMVFVGKISYSLYLFHWPVYVFVKQFYIVSHWEKWTILFISLLLGVLSWRYIETPFRRATVSKRKTLVCASVMFIMFPIGLSFISEKEGFPDRVSAKTETLLNAFKFTDRQNKCTKTKRCKIGKEGAASFALVGDSHAQMLIEIFHDMAEEHSKSGIFMTGGGCPAVSNVEKEFQKSTCTKSHRKILDEIVSDPHIEYVFLASRWVWYIDGPEHDCFQDCRPPRTVTNPKTDDSRYESMTKGLSETLRTLVEADKKVVVIKQVPKQKFNPPNYFATLNNMGVPYNERKGRTMTSLMTRFTSSEKMFSEVLRYKNVIYIDPVDILCFDNNCPTMKNGVVLYKDDDHLSIDGTKLLKNSLVEYFL